MCTGSWVVEHQKLIRDYVIVEDNVIIGDNLDTGYFVVLRNGVKLGDDVKIWSHCTIDPGACIGDRTRIHNCVYVSQGVIIEEDVFIGPGCQILNDKYPVRTDPRDWQPPIIRKGAIIGGGVTIAPDVEIGEGAIIGAGSTVIKPVPAGQVWAGNPARRLR